MNVLRYISVLCGTMDAEITADVYLMNDNAVVPSDGVLLDRVVKDVYYGGYYRIQSIRRTVRVLCGWFQSCVV
jgi:hypothetical protein